METLSKVNEQKDNVLAPNTTLSLSETLARGIKGRGGECQRTQVYKCEPFWFSVVSFLGWQVILGGLLLIVKAWEYTGIPVS